ncbi:hypothetical protein J31TS4_33600 [Paenibacillus sp. J31TS4]|uniref:hypothetical protein n=1 Tax=Paenibacillus sp. J31TS4 TaxID=2807195 RepID=UPI001B26CE6F|nr:hypothetical protein [Paenibacillus sp. J31TS4]GIP40080.1 hypothetical protein J31TS4_33600 [Paenibacillus sp. J31TS4]
MSENKQMNPMSGEPVEVDGVYETEWGRQEQLSRGDIFPADPVLGSTEWELVEYGAEHDAFANEDDDGKLRRHAVRGDK